ncbi:MAG: AAA family ATPase, partial [Thermoflexibacteraceae bacterium]
MQAATIRSKQPKLDENNVFEVSPKLQLLTSKAIYGANASGKSNIIKALLAFVWSVKQSVSVPNIFNQLIKKYELSTDTDTEPTFFQLVFTVKNADNKEIVFRYGFEVKDN